MRFDLSPSETGEALITEQTASNFAKNEAKKFPTEKYVSELPWLCIGNMPGTRNFIGNTAIAHVHQLLKCSLEFRNDLNVQNMKSQLPIYQEASIRGRKTPFTKNSSVALDLTGPPDGSFRKKFRSYSNEQEKLGVNNVIEVVHFMGMTAMKRIQLLMNEIPGAIGLDTVSSTWTLATLSRRSGQQIMAGDDPNGSTIQFGVIKEFK